MNSNYTAHLNAKIGDKLGPTNWLEVTQEDTNLFGQVTKDPDPLHIDPAAAAKGPFGHTIAFGFYTLSLLTYFYHELTASIGNGHALNYGLNKVRFLSKVSIGSRVRAFFELKDISHRNDGMTLVVLEVTVEIEGVEKPAMVAEWLGCFLAE